MSRTLLTLTLVLLVPTLRAAEPKKERKPSPFAPSLPQLTDAEEEEIDRTVDRFIQYDIGRLRGEDGKQALKDFEKLGPEAVFGLIRGLNRAARLEASCPVLTIGKKVAGILRGTNDSQLLDFARENIGAGTPLSLHQGLLRELRVMAMFRKRSVLAAKQAAPSYLRSKTVFELTTALKKEERVPRRRAILTELASRRGEGVIDALEANTTDTDSALQTLAKDLLTRNLSRLSSTALKAKLKDDRPAVRLASVGAIQRKGYRLGKEFVELLNDQSSEVGQAAHQALVKLSGGKDFGPGTDASESERYVAVEQWRSWWSKQSRR